MTPALQTLCKLEGMFRLLKCLVSPGFLLVMGMILQLNASRYAQRAAILCR